MSAQLLFQNTSEFLSTSSKGLCNEPYIPVKAKRHTYNPIMLPELIGEVLKYVNLKDMWQCSKAHPIWNMEVNLELYKRKTLLDRKFKDLIKKCIEAYDNWYSCQQVLKNTKKLVIKNIFYLMKEEKLNTN